MAPLSTIVAAAADSAGHSRHRIALRLLPFLFVLYIINYLDRTSVAYAAIGMARDLGFNNHALGMGIGIFFVCIRSGDLHVVMAAVTRPRVSKPPSST